MGFDVTANMRQLLKGCQGNILIEFSVSKAVCLTFDTVLFLVSADHHWVQPIRFLLKWVRLGPSNTLK